MKEQLEKVKNFHETFQQSNAEVPTLLNQREWELRHRIMQEEVDEYLEACVEGNIVGIADALGDQLYILCGTILKHGLQHKIEEVFHEIHMSNMSKLDENGKPILRKDGKILKGKGYFQPDIKKILDN